jgi:glycosyltransferase involved in cell wall biosynthesis
LKILRIIARLNVGGPARHVVILDQGLQSRGHDTLLIHGTIEPGEASLESDVEKAGIRAKKIPELGRRVRVLGDMTALAQIIKLAFQERPDVVHTHTAKAGTLGRIAAFVFNATRPSSRRCIVVHTFHGHVFHGYFGPVVNTIVRLIEYLLAKLTTRIVTISQRQYLEITDGLRIAPASRTVVIPLGLNLDQLFGIGAASSNDRESLGIAPEDIVVGYIGRMVPIKDLGTLIRGFGEALRGHPRLWLMLAGGGPLRESLRQLTHECRVSNRVLFRDWTDDLPRLYGTMDICALTSLNEGTPVAAIEAMAAGKPVVSTAVGGVPDVVQHGVTGLLVPPRDPSALASAIAQLCSEPELRRRMGEAGRRRAAEYTSERLVRDVERLYIAALAQARGV